MTRLMEVTISIARDELEILEPLEIVTSGCGEGSGSFWVRFDTLVRPDFTMRRKYSSGTVWSPPDLLAAVRDSAVLVFGVMVQGDSPEDLVLKMKELEDAVSQFEYEVSLTLDGVTNSWAADPTLPSWSVVNYQLQDHNMARGVLQIPIQPAGA